MASLDHRAQVRVTRIIAGLLRFLGVRETVVRWRLARARSRRAQAEARGDDRLSRPGLHEVDVKLNAIMDRAGGFFIEAGAHDGFTKPNTYWLEHFRGWHGLLVEPMPTLAAEARLSRPGARIVECALGPEEGGTVRMRFGDLMSMVDGARESSWPALGTVLGWRDPYEVEVPTDAVVAARRDRPSEIDLLSLDVEVFEAQALAGLHLDRHAPH